MQKQVKCCMLNSEENVSLQKMLIFLFPGTHSSETSLSAAADSKRYEASGSKLTQYEQIEDVTSIL